jgi:diguanylate cyclase
MTSQAEAIIPVNQIIELGLNRRRKESHDRLISNIIWLLDQLLELMSGHLAEGDVGSVAPFSYQLNEPRHEIVNAIKDIKESVARQTLDLCQGQFERVQLKRFERDETLAGIILLLRASLANLAGDSRGFHDNLIGTTDRIKAFADLKDIQEFKKRVAVEIGEVNKLILEKQTRDQVQYAQLSGQIVALQRKLDEAKTEASLDALTGIANRRSFDITFQRWIRAHEKSEEPFTTAFLDLDDFKRINDNYGHPVGDQVLSFAAKELSKNIRPSDFLARYGGEEFVILSEGMKLSDSEKRFSELLKQIERMRYECTCDEKGAISILVTASCGVAEYALGESATDLISRADEALYEAKRQGKNRVALKRRSLLSAFYEGRKRNMVAKI